MIVDMLGVFVAASSAFLLGGLWYAPAAFGRLWRRAAGIPEERLAARNPIIVFGGAFMLSLLSASVFALFLGPDPSFRLAAGAGIAAGLCWVAASFGVNYLFEARPPTLFLINGGYHTLQFTLYGLILGVWP